jgi:Domain of unknown function (DUF4190)
MAGKEDQHPPQNVCLRCGKLVSGADNFCVSCGSDLKAPPLSGQSSVAGAVAFNGLGPGLQTGGGPPPYATAYPAAAWTPVAYPLALRKTEELAVISFICGIASFVMLPLIPAIAAVILGSIARNRIRANPAGLEGNGLAVAGLILGLVNIALILILVVLAIIARASEAALLI